MRSVGRPVVLVVAGLTLGAAGCKSSSNVELPDFGDEAAGTICGKVYECCMAMELTEHMGYSGGFGECGIKSAKDLGFWAAIIEKEQDKGRLAYDPAVARRCLSAFAAASCEAHKRNEPLDGCDAFITPKTAVGAACNAHESCTGGECQGVSAGTEGVCRAFVGDGQSCTDAPCAKGLYCEPGGKVCRPRKRDGETCNLHGQCQSAGCNGRNPDAGTPGSCGLKGGADSRCFVTTGCSYGGGVGAAAGVAGGLWVLLALLALRLRRRRR